MPVDLIKDRIAANKVTPLRYTEIEDYEETADYWFVLGYLYDEAGMHKEAVEAYKQGNKD